MKRLFKIMDIDALHSTLLCEVENDLRIAKATLGGELGFSLCPLCWPPELVATDHDGKLNCPVCGRVSHEQAA